MRAPARATPSLDCGCLMLCLPRLLPPPGVRTLCTALCLAALVCAGCRHLGPTGALVSENATTPQATTAPDEVGEPEPIFSDAVDDPFLAPEIAARPEGAGPFDFDALDASAPFTDPGIGQEHNPDFCGGLLVEDCPVHFSGWDDLKTLLPTLWADTCSVLRWENAVILGVAAGGAVAIRDNLDGETRAYTAEFPLRWGEGSEVLRQFGEFSWQVPVIAGVYGWSLFAQDEKLHQFTTALISAYGITAITTVLIKAATDTQRPSNQFQDGRYGFPSYHAASTFAIASVIDEYYGWPLGLPSYVMAGLVGWTRIDQREHDLSDVFFGSVLGFVIGKSIACAHLERYGNWEIYPCFDPVVRGVGFTFSKSY